MKTEQAFIKGEKNRGKELMVFDWNKAAQFIKERKPIVAEAGLKNDWEYTGGQIFCDGAPTPHEDTYVYLASTWAIPEIDLDGDVVECYIMANEVPTEWGNDFANIYWPESALVILNNQS